MGMQYCGKRWARQSMALVHSRQVGLVARIQKTVAWIDKFYIFTANPRVCSKF
jgi:hypothetical protein